MLPDPSPAPEGDREKPFFGPVQFGGADLNYMEPGEIKFMRQGMIPCGRCAFFEPSQMAKKDPTWTDGTCRAKSPAKNETWPEVDSDPDRGHGCGEGLLREEAAPLPPEVRPC